MRSDISDSLVAAANSSIRVPLLRAYIYQPGHPETYVDVGPYTDQMELRIPINVQPTFLQLTCSNPRNVLSLNPLVTEDYVVDLYLGYFKHPNAQFTPQGRYYIDAPQREFSVSPPKNQVIIQARDGWKLFAERAFEGDELIDLSDRTVQQAITDCAALVTVAGVSPTVVFDTDDDSVAALNITTAGIIAGPSDTTHDAYALMQDVLKVSGLQAQWRYDGALRVGMMRQLTSVATYGDIGALHRPVWQRQHRRTSRTVYNVVHVQGDTAVADIEDTGNIAAIGRRKYLFIDDPSISTEEQALLRARQELELSQRFRDQPDFVTSWTLDLERRDVITLDDEGATGLPRGDYRIENLTFSFQAAPPKDELSLGLGLPDVENTTETTATPSVV